MSWFSIIFVNFRELELEVGFCKISNVLPVWDTTTSAMLVRKGSFSCSYKLKDKQYLVTPIYCMCLFQG